MWGRYSVMMGNRRVVWRVETELKVGVRRIIREGWRVGLVL